MPKIVDADSRRALIAEAVISLIVRGGIEEASLRNVAAQSGLNIGSVRHYVDGYEGMLIDAVRHMAQQVAGRLEARLAAAAAEFGGLAPAGLAPEEFVRLREVAIDMLEELLPLDEERRREVVVWLAFCERSRTAPGLRDEARVLMEGARQLARPLLEAAGSARLDLATEALAATLDGLAIALLHDPDRLSREQRREILDVCLGAAVRWPSPQLP